MQKRQGRARREARIESRTSGKPWMLRGREKHIGAPHGRGKADGDEKKGCGPDQAGGAFRRRENS